MKAAGGSPLYTEIPNGGHDIWDDVYDDAQTHRYGLYEWLFSQSKVPALIVPEPATIWLGLFGALAISSSAARRADRKRPNS